jgi:histidinol dehydrogenase
LLEVIDGRQQQGPVHITRPVPVKGQAQSDRTVTEIVDDVREHGDAALLRWTERLDGPRLAPQDLLVSPDLIEKARRLVRPELLDALEVMAERLRFTCERQRPVEWMERRDDEFVGELIRPLKRVGAYVPGGRGSYPSSVLMTAIPASVAGVEGIAIATPPDGRGEISDATLAACSVAGVSEVYRMGGAQAIAALAYGTETVRPVSKIVGPGNLYVTLAKKLVSGWVGIDSMAGPSEIAIVSDDVSFAEPLALDLIAQAEHGPLGSHVLITWDRKLIDAVLAMLDSNVISHERSEDVENHLIEGGVAVLVRDLDHAIETVNAFAPEHLELVFEGAQQQLHRFTDAGSIFVGRYSPVAVGDYVGGTNHVLPTGGTARFSDALGVNDFVKRIYVSGFEMTALERLAPHVEALSEAESLRAHGRSVWGRLDG